MSYNFQKKHCFEDIYYYFDNLDKLYNIYRELYQNKLPKIITILPYNLFNIKFNFLNINNDNGDVIYSTDVIKFYFFKTENKILELKEGKVYVVSKNNIIRHLMGVKLEKKT